MEEHQDQPPRHTRVRRLRGRRDRRTRRRGRCIGGGRRHGRRRGRHRTHVPRSGQARGPGALRRRDDGQGERRLRRGLLGDPLATHTEGRRGRDPDRQRRLVPRHHQSLHQARARLQGRHQVRRIRGDGDPRRGARTVRPLPRRDGRGGGRHRRCAAREVLLGRGDPKRRRDSRDEGGDEARRDLPAALLLGHAHLRRPDHPRLPRASHAVGVRDGGTPCAARRGRRPHRRDPPERRRALHRTGLQDDQRTACRRGVVLPHLQRPARERRGDLELHTQRAGEALAPRGAARQGATRGAAPVPRRHRLRREAPQHAHERHTEHEGTSGATAGHPVPRSSRLVRHRGHRARRRGEAADGTAPSPRRGPDDPDALRVGDARVGDRRTR